MISVRNLDYFYGQKKALNHVNFDIDAGEFCALLGPNGAGKSTLFGILSGLIASKSATISLSGHDLVRDRKSALASLGIVFQQSTLDLDLSVLQNLKYFAALHGLTGRLAHRQIDKALDTLGLRERILEKVRTLNGGHRRRTEIARALIHQPAILLLDEATVGLDAETRSNITDYVHELSAKGMTVLWATHLTDEIRPSDRLLVLHQSSLLYDGQTSEFSSNPEVKFLEMTKNTE